MIFVLIYETHNEMILVLLHHSDPLAGESPSKSRQHGRSMPGLLLKFGFTVVEHCISHNEPGCAQSNAIVRNEIQPYHLSQSKMTSQIAENYIQEWTMRAVISSILLASIVMHAHAGENNATYPEKPVRIVVGFTAGGPTDVIGRAFANFVGIHTGKDMIIENKPGANSTIATRYVSQAKPDGYTLLGAATNHTMIPALYGTKVSFDVEKSFVPICTFAKSPTVLVVSAELNVKDFADLLNRMKQEPGKLLAASAGVGSSGHFATALFEKIAQVRLNHVPYNGAAPAITAVMGSQIDMSFATLASVLPQASSGKLKILAVASEARQPSLPDVPTFSEAGIKGYAADAWYGFLAPAGTPANVIAKLEEYVKAYRVDKTAQTNLKLLGLEPDASCGADFAAKIRHDVHTYTELAKNIGIEG